jgi:hypothetical protein
MERSRCIAFPPAPDPSARHLATTEAARLTPDDRCRLPDRRGAFRGSLRLPQKAQSREKARVAPSQAEVCQLRQLPGLRRRTTPAEMMPDDIAIDSRLGTPWRSPLASTPEAPHREQLRQAQAPQAAAPPATTALSDVPPPHKTKRPPCRLRRAAPGLFSSVFPGRGSMAIVSPPAALASNCIGPAAATTRASLVRCRRAAHRRCLRRPASGPALGVAIPTGVSHPRPYPYRPASRRGCAGPPVPERRLRCARRLCRAASSRQSQPRRASWCSSKRIGSDDRQRIALWCAVLLPGSAAGGYIQPWLKCTLPQEPLDSVRPCRQEAGSAGRHCGSPLALPAGCHHWQSNGPSFRSSCLY